jgi:hypothetical protein
MQKLSQTIFNQNPFFILGASPRDSKAKIIELADEASLTKDSDLCDKARSDLTNPRNRVASEISWFPGVSPKKAKELVNLAVNSPEFILNEFTLPPLVLVNLWVPFFEAVNDQDNVDLISDAVIRFADLLQQISPEQILRDLNEDRSVSGFSEISSIETIEEALADRKKFFRTTVKDALNRLSTDKLISVTTSFAESSTVNGNNIAPDFIYTLIDAYEVEAQSVLNKELENVDKLCSVIISNASSKVSLEPNLSTLNNLSKNFVRLAKPIQLSFKSRGLVHDLSQNYAYKVRDLAIQLTNKYDLTDVSLSLTKINQDLFSNIPEFMDRLENDENTLLEIKENQANRKEKDAEWAREITYSAEIGLVMKETLQISPAGASYGGKNIPLENITYVGWGAVSNSVNGIPTGTDHNIFWGDDKSRVSVNTRRGTVYSEFINRLWKATAAQLLDQMINHLKSGNSLIYKEMTIWDDRVMLKKSNFFSSQEIISPWSDITIMSFQGSLYLTNSKDKKITGAIPYMTTKNAHVLETLIRAAFKKPSMKKLSEAFT